MAPPAVLSIAGSDSGGGAGIQADLKAFAHAGVHGMTAITALTAQNTVGVTGIHPVPPEFIVEQVRAVQADIGVDAVKIGMLGTAVTVRAVAEALAAHPGVSRVHYPGLPDDPGHAVARRQMSGFGAMLSFRLRGGEEAALRVIARVKIFLRATSLGGVESLIEHRFTSEGPGSTAPRELLRCSIGLEHPDDLVEDLRQALD